MFGHWSISNLSGKLSYSSDRNDGSQANCENKNYLILTNLLHPRSIKCLVNYLPVQKWYEKGCFFQCNRDFELKFFCLDLFQTNNSPSSLYIINYQIKEEGNRVTYIKKIQRKLPIYLISKEMKRKPKIKQSLCDSVLSGLSREGEEILENQHF